MESFIDQLIDEIRFIRNDLLNIALLPGTSFHLVDRIICDHNVMLLVMHDEILWWVALALAIVDRGLI